MDEVPLLVEHVTMLEIVGEVLVKDVVAHIVVVVVFVGLLVPCTAVVVMELVAFVIVVEEVSMDFWFHLLWLWLWNFLHGFFL